MNKGDKMNGNGDVRDYKSDYEQLHRVMETQNRGIMRQNADMDKLREDVQLHIDIANSLEKQMLQLKTINQNLMTSQNAKNQELIDEIERLRGMVKELGGNPN